MKAMRSVAVTLFFLLALGPQAGFATPALQTGQAIPTPTFGSTIPSAAIALSLASPAPPTPLEALASSGARVSTDPATGLVRFAGSDAAHPLWAPDVASRNSSPTGPISPEKAARAFLAANGALFGLSDQAAELSVMRSDTADGASYVRFQQHSGGIPVLGGELIVQTDATGAVISAGGKTLTTQRVTAALKPVTVTREDAATRAMAAAASINGAGAAALTAAQPSLWVYSPGLIGTRGGGPDHLVWRTLVTAAEPPVREFVLINAATGSLDLNFSQIESALFRVVYDNHNSPLGTLPGLPGEGPVRIEGQGASGVADADKFFDNAGVFYDFYLNMHSRDSIDGAGMPIVGTVRYCSPLESCPYDNAFWNGSQMVFGQGYASALDVVAHEMTHGVTQNESNLFYIYQSGAINESLSDIWGEFIEKTNDVTADPAWLVGEDLPPAYPGAPNGAIRSMQNPLLYGDPNKMSSGAYYCQDGDAGGVHHNSGVGNQAAYLIAHGGTVVGGGTAPGMGVYKAAKIYYELQTHLLTSAGDYLDLYNGLQQACSNLTGRFGITPADCGGLRQALDAVQMSQQPASCATPQAPVCPAGQVPHDLFSDDLENPSLGNWVSGSTAGNTNLWFYPEPAGQMYATSGTRMMWGSDLTQVNASYYIALDKDIALPAAAYLRFNHAYFFRYDGTTPPAGGTAYDGGIVEYSADGGGSWHDAGGLFADNGYNTSLSIATANPLAGRPAFGGMSDGYRSSRINLSSLAGGTFRFRFRIGSSTKAFSVDPNRPEQYLGYGWFIDDPRIYTCAGRPTGSSTYLPSIARSPLLDPAAPAMNAIANVGGYADYTVSWSSTPDAGAYVLAEAAGPDFANALLWNTASATHQDFAGKPAGTYYYRVKALSNAGESPWSAPQQTTVVRLGAPNLLPIANAAGLASYQVTWDLVTGATSYALVEDTDGAFPHPTTVYQGDLSTWNATGKQAGTYYYRVRASSSAGDGLWSVTRSTIVQTVPAGWSVLLNDDFEGAFPGQWQVDDSGGLAAGYRWGQSTCRPFAGTYSAWAVGGGPNGGALPCHASYPNNAGSWMVYGPFATSSVNSAELSYQVWYNAEAGYDGLCAMASTDNYYYYGDCWQGSSTTWSFHTLNLASVPAPGNPINMLAQPHVWVAFVFTSDPTETMAEGGYVDNVTLRVCPSGQVCPLLLQPALPGGAEAEPAMFLRPGR